MTNTQPITINIRTKIIGTIVLALLALLGNISNLPLVFGVSFIFGSIAVMLAVALLGTLPAIIVALVGGSYTIILWGHPYAAMVFTLEALVVGLLYQRGLRNLVFADLLYWAIVGIPTVILFYSQMLDLNWDATLLIALKQALNGIFNALIVGLIILGLQLFWRHAKRLQLEPPRITNLQFHVLLIAILISGAVPIIHEGHSQRELQEHFMAERLHERAINLAKHIETAPNTQKINWQRELIQAQINPEMGLALLDDSGKVFATQGDIASAQTPTQIQTLDTGLMLWTPEGDMATMHRWKKGRYLITHPIKDIPGVSALIIEQSAEDTIVKLEQFYLTLFSFLMGFLLLIIIISQLLSRWLSQPIKHLELASRNLSKQIAEGSLPNLPTSAIQEYNSLSNTLVEMSSQLANSFQQLHEIQIDLEHQVEKRTSELRESQERFLFAVEGAGDALWDWDMINDKVLFSKLYMEMLGYDNHELPQQADTWTKLIHPDDLDWIQQKLKDYLKGKISAYSNELRLKCKDGSYKWTLCRGTVVERDATGNPIRMIGINSDISERKQAEQALINARDEAEQANHAKSDFLSSMSHELRTPLNAIIGFSQLFEYETGLADDLKENASEIHKAGNHLLSLINDVLDLATIESGKTELLMEEVPLNSILNECRSLMMPVAKAHNVTLEIVLPTTEIPLVRADYTRLKQIFLNLLSNAIKYNRQNGSILMSCSVQGTDFIRIHIKDTGIGIPQDQLNNLFEPFNRLGAQNGNIPGTGIGLVITKDLVELMGGRIGVESIIGQGSTFWIDLKSAALSNALTHPKSSDELSSNDYKKMAFSDIRLLIAEDNPSNQMVLQKQLEHLGLQADIADNGLMAWEYLQKNSYDLLLTDIKMPIMDGYKLVENIRQAEQHTGKHLPIIAITANAMAADAKRCLEQGMDAFIAKPIRFDELQATLTTWLPKRGQSTHDT